MAEELDFVISQCYDSITFSIYNDCEQTDLYNILVDFYSYLNESEFMDGGNHMSRLLNFTLKLLQNRFSYKFIEVVEYFCLTNKIYDKEIKDNINFTKNLFEIENLKI